MKKLLIFALTTIAVSVTYAQRQTVSIGTEAVNENAVLWLTSPTEDQGLIIPLVSGTDAVNASAADKGMIVFDLSQNVLTYFNGTAWTPITLSEDPGENIVIDGNQIRLNDGPNESIAEIQPTQSGQLLLWSGSQWTSSGASPPQTDQILRWNGTTWVPSPDGAGNNFALSGAVNGQLLRYNGTQWVPTNDNSVTNALPAGQMLVGNNAGLASPVTINGDLSVNSAGTATIAANAVTSSKLADASVTTAQLADDAVNSSKISPGSIQASDLSSMGATNGQILKFNGTSWVLAVDNSGGLPVLNAGQIYVGDPGNFPTAVTVSGDMSITNTGTATIQNGAVTSVKVADGTIATADLANAAVNNQNIADAAVTSSKIADGTIAAADLNTMGASSGQVLKFNGASWAPAADLGVSSTLNSGLILVGSAANTATPVAMSGDATISNTGVVSISNNAINSARILDGSVVSADIANGSITSALIADNTIAAADLNSMGASSGQVLKFNGASWAPAADIGITNTLNSGLILVGNATNLATPVAMSGDATISNTGVVSIANNAIHSTRILDGSIATADIANSAITSTLIADQTITGSDLANNAVSSLQIADASVTSAKIADNTIAAADLAAMGASANQVLKFNGANWAPATDQGISTTLNSGQMLVGNGSNVATAVTMSGDATISNTGVVTIANNAISSAKIADNTIVAADLNTMGASANQVLKFNGANWAPATDQGISTTLNSGQMLVGNGSNVATAVTMSGDATVSNTGVVTIANNAISSSKIADNTIVAADLNTMGASANQVLKFNGSNWAPATDQGISTTLNSAQMLVGNGSNVATAVTMSGDATISNAGVVSIANNAITSARILDGSIATADIANSAITSALIADQTITANDLANNAVSTLQIADASVTSAKIVDATISSNDLATSSVINDKLAAGAVTADKLSSMSASADQYLRYNGSAWAPASFTGWTTAGNNGTTSGNFIGTTDNVPLSFRVSNVRAGRLSASNTFIGYQAGLLDGQMAEQGASNTAVGTSALASNTANNNVAVGTMSLSANSTGGANTAIGSLSLQNNTTGTNNVAAGHQALSANTSGYGNVAIGRDALAANTTANENTAVGHLSLISNTTGDQNSALGAWALSSNTIGTGNTATGYLTLGANTTGSSNAAFGAHALYQNTVGHQNAAFGRSALSNSTGNNNTACGAFCLFNTSSGSANTAIGTSALAANTTGSQNTAIGSSTFSSGAAYSNSTAIGYNAQVSQSNMIRLGDANVTLLSAQVDITVTSDRRFKTDIQEKVVGLPFIMKLRPVTYHFDMDKLNSFTGGAALPENTVTEKPLHTGFIAQEVESAANEVGYDFSGIHKPVNDKDYYGLRYEEFTVPLVKAIQEQQLMIEKLQQRIAALEANNTSLKEANEKTIGTMRAELDEIKSIVGIQAQKK